MATRPFPKPGPTRFLPMNEQHAVNGLTQNYCDGLALNETEDPARYRQAAERGGLFALHDELSAETSAQRSPSRRLLDSVVARLRLGRGDLFDRAGVDRKSTRLNSSH